MISIGAAHLEIIYILANRRPRLFQIRNLCRSSRIMVGSVSDRYQRILSSSNRKCHHLLGDRNGCGEPNCWPALRSDPTTEKGGCPVGIGLLYALLLAFSGN